MGRCAAKWRGSLDGDASALVELKAVDGAYPLYGTVELDGASDLATALAPIDGRWGAAVDPIVLDRLGLALGDTVRIGEATLELRATIRREPDRAGGGTFTLGPRVMIAEPALAATDLTQPGSMIYWHYRLALPPETTTQAFRADLAEAWPSAGWRVRDFTDAAPQLQRMIERLALFLTLVGLTALLVGGVGVGNAVKSYLDGRLATIATLKCLGAPSRLVFQVYLIQILALAAAGTAIGLAVGIAAPFAVAWLIADLLPIEARFGIYPGALALAAGFGLLTALTFSLLPLARARLLPAGALFRDLVAPTRGRRDHGMLIALAASSAALGGLAIVNGGGHVVRRRVRARCRSRRCWRSAPPPGWHGRGPPRLAGRSGRALRLGARQTCTARGADAGGGPVRFGPFGLTAPGR